MDVGLNNTNRLHLATGIAELEHVKYLVEANTNEQFELWRNKHADDVWVQKQGYSVKVCDLRVELQGKPESAEVLPVMVSFMLAEINDVLVAFYSSDSLLSHHGYIEEFLSENFQLTHDNYSRWNHTNATNFHTGCLRELDELPRESKRLGTARYSRYSLLARK